MSKDVGIDGYDHVEKSLAFQHMGLSHYQFSMLGALKTGLSQKQELGEKVAHNEMSAKVLVGQDQGSDDRAEAGQFSCETLGRETEILIHP